MKKATVFICSLILAITLTACGSGSSGSDMSGGASGGNGSSGSNMGGSSGGNGSAGGGSDNGTSGGSMGSSVESSVDSVVSGISELVAKISGDEAKKAALDHAGLKESDVKDLDVDLDRDNGVLKYEVDFRHGDIEYDYDIDAQTGTVLTADKDR